MFDFVKLTELYYAGSHGMDIMGPVGEHDSVTDHRSSINSNRKQVWRALYSSAKHNICFQILVQNMIQYLFFELN